MTRPRATSKPIKSFAARIGDPNVLAIGSEFDARWATTHCRNGLNNTVVGSVNDSKYVASVIADPNFTAVWRDINANRLTNE